MILTLISLAGVFRLKVETDVYGFFKKSHEIRIAKEKTDSWFKGVLPFEVVFRNIPQDSVIVFAKKFISLDEKILNIDQVGTCLSIHDLFDYLSLDYTNSQRRLIPGNLYKVFYDPKEKLLRYTIKTKWINHQEVIQKVGQFKRTIQQALHISSESFYITGVSILFANLNNELVDNQIKSLLISLLVLMFLLMITFRSFFYLTVGIIPNILPVFNTLAIMGIIGIPLDVGTVLIAAVSLGVAIDDTIYFIHKFRSLKNMPVSERILITYTSLFRQLLITSVVVCLGFIVMASSSYLPIIYLGIFVSTNIALAFIYDMIVLPVLLSMKNKNF
jgi:hypothetical protein